VCTAQLVAILLIKTGEDRHLSQGFQVYSGEIAKRRVQLGDHEENARRGIQGGKYKEGGTRRKVRVKECTSAKKAPTAALGLNCRTTSVVS
jgi:hypothetical protein